METKTAAESAKVEPMVEDFITLGEIRAVRIIYGRPTTTDASSPSNDHHDAGNQIIMLAEQIKAERAIIAARGRA